MARGNKQKGRSGRIREKYFSMLGNRYTKDSEQKLFDLFVYFKYYLPKSEYKQFVSKLKGMLNNLEIKIHPHAFENIRAQMGIKNMDDLDILTNMPKDEIEYNKFDK